MLSGAVQTHESRIIQGSNCFSRGADDQGPLRENLVFGDERARAYNRMRSNLCSVHDGRTHADQDVIAQ